MGIPEGRANRSNSRVGTLVDLLVVPLERSPRVKVVPKVVEPFDLLLAGVGTAKLGDGLDLGEPGLSDKDRAKDFGVLVGGDGLGVGDLVLDVPVDRVELSSSLGVGQGLVGWGVRFVRIGLWVG